MSVITVQTESDPVPLVRIIATQLRRAARHAELAKRMAAMRGVAAIACTVDPQAATLRFDRGSIIVARGVASDVGVTIRTNVNTMSRIDAEKPKVSGAARHPRFALALSKVLEPPERPWIEDASEFLAFVARHPRCPAVVRVVGLDDGAELVTGGDLAAVEYEIHGTAHSLRNLFTGNTIFGEELFEGRLFAVGALAHTAELSGQSLAWAMGGGQ